MSEKSGGAGRPGVCYVVSYDHGGRVLWGYEHFLSHFRGLLEWLDRHPRLKMGLDKEAWMYDWLAENQPAVLEEIRRALARYRGRLDNPDVHLTAFYTNAAHLYLRLFNDTDEPQEVRCPTLDRFTPVKVDVRHRELGLAERPLVLSPWQFVTLRLF
jgi:hypothetical protein